jgi:ribosomal-protein-serine acetyltransferase
MPSIHLEVPEPPAAAEVADAVGESLGELMPWMDWCSPGYSLHDAAAWIASTLYAREQREAFEFLIRSDSGRLLGCCGVNNIDTANRFANLGYWVRTSAADQGVATAAARILADWAFEHTDLERLEIMPAVANMRSQSVARGAGAQREGVLASRLLVHGTFLDAVMFSMTRSRWRPA